MTQVTLFGLIALLQGFVAIPAYARGDGTQFFEIRHAIQRTENNRAPAEAAQSNETNGNGDTAKKTAEETNTNSGNANTDSN